MELKTSAYTYYFEFVVQSTDKKCRKQDPIYLKDKALTNLQKLSDVLKSDLNKFDNGKRYNEIEMEILDKKPMWVGLGKKHASCTSLGS